MFDTYYNQTQQTSVSSAAPLITAPTSSNVTYYMYNGCRIQSEVIPPTSSSTSTTTAASVTTITTTQSPTTPSQQQQQQQTIDSKLKSQQNPQLIAYPGDIFYKVKDVTESSTSDSFGENETPSQTPPPPTLPPPLPTSQPPISTNTNNNNINKNSFKQLNNGVDSSTITKKQTKFDSPINGQPVTTWKKQATVNNNNHINYNEPNNVHNDAQNVQNTTQNNTNEKLKQTDDTPIISKELHTIR